MNLQFCSVQSLSHVWLCDPMISTLQASLSITSFRSLLKLMSMELVVPSNHLILCHPLLPPPSIFPSIPVFSSSQLFASGGQSTGASFSMSISPSSEHSGLISFRIDWFDLIAVQGTLKSLLQHHNLKVSILQCSAFCMVQLPHLYMTTRKWLYGPLWAKWCLCFLIHGV